MIIENGIQDGVDFFHMDALSSAVAMKVNCDVQLLSWPAVSIGSWAPRWETATRRPNRAISSETLVNAGAQVTLSQTEVTIRMHKRSHNPLLDRRRLPSHPRPHPLARRQNTALRLRILTSVVLLNYLTWKSRLAPQRIGFGARSPKLCVQQVVQSEPCRRLPRAANPGGDVGRVPVLGMRPALRLIRKIAMRKVRIGICSS